MEPADRRTANDRFKASWGKFLGAGMLSAVAIEIAILATAPDFSVPVEYRMVIVADTLQNIEWPASGQVGSPADSARQRPRITNLAVLQLSLPRVYPSLPWEIRLENALTVKVWIDADGVVTRVRPVEPGVDLGADEAMTELARLLRYTPARIGSNPVPVAGLQRLSVEAPWFTREREWRR